jgi:thiol-disulfide isomerase/thioredoxin
MISPVTKTRTESRHAAATMKRWTSPRIADFFHSLKLNCGLTQQLELAPSSLRDLDGKRTTIDAHIGKGRWSLVVIWSSRCSLCAAEMPRYGAYHAASPDCKFSLLGVALDGFARRHRIAETMTRWNLGFPTLVAEGLTLQWTCGEPHEASIYGTPTFMLFDPSGTLRKLNLGPVWISELETFIRDSSLQ